MSEKVLTLVVAVEVQAGKKDFVKSQMENLVAETRKEAGCINYDVHEDNENENILVFHENWETTAHWEAHDKSAHLAAYRESTKGIVSIKNFMRLTKVNF